MGVWGMTIQNLDKSSCLTAHYLPNRVALKTISTRLVSTLTELKAVYRFRYQIYVDEMSLTQFYADNTRKMIEDPLDQGAYNFAAFQNGEVVGVIRLNFTRNSNILYYEDFLDMKSAGRFHPSATSIATRLMIVPRLRGTSIALRLCQAAYTFGLHHKIRFNFVDCGDHLTRFFERLGYTVQGRAQHPEYGIGNVMRLDLLDRAYLTRIGSPFLPILNAVDNPWSECVPGKA